MPLSNRLPLKKTSLKASFAQGRNYASKIFLAINKKVLSHCIIFIVSINSSINILWSETFFSNTTKCKFCLSSI